MISIDRNNNSLLFGVLPLSVEFRFLSVLNE
jgi:hypothetical protein